MLRTLEACIQKFPQDALEEMNCRLQSAQLVQNLQPAIKMCQYNYENGLLSRSILSSEELKQPFHGSSCLSIYSLILYHDGYKQERYAHECTPGLLLNPGLSEPQQTTLKAPSLDIIEKKIVMIAMKQKTVTDICTMHTLSPEPRKCWLKFPFSINS